MFLFIGKFLNTKVIFKATVRQCNFASILSVLVKFAHCQILGSGWYTFVIKGLRSALAYSKDCVAHYAISDLAGNFGGHRAEFLLSVFTLLLLTKLCRGGEC